MVKNVWLDMDGTIVNFAKSNLEEALQRMHDPSYYRNLEPMGNVVDILGDLSDRTSICIVSGIPDLTRHRRYLEDYILTPTDYMQYFQAVEQEKRDWIKKYFGNNFFDLQQYTRASESKAHTVKTRWYDSFEGEPFTSTCLLDDQEAYCTTWRKLGGKAITVSKKSPVSVAIRTLMEE